MPNYKLTYFNGKGRAELIRLILAYTGEKFDDNRIEPDHWFNSVKATTPWGGMPLLEVDGKPLAQSNTIVRYLGKKLGWTASSDWEQALIESAIDYTEDIFTGTTRVFKAEASKREEEAGKFRNDLPTILANLEKFAGQHGQNGHVVGDKLTLADLAVYNIVDQLITLKHLPQQDLEKYPKIRDVFKKVQSDSKLEQYLKNRPQTAF